MASIPTNIEEIAFVDARIGSMEAELKQLKAIRVALSITPVPIPEPDKPRPDPVKPKLYGDPRVQVGTIGTDNVYDSAAGLLLVFPADIDRFMPVGYNKDYTPLSGVSKPSGLATPNYGNDAPTGFVKPNGYRVRYFPGDGRAYYEQSDLADEEPPIKQGGDKPSSTNTAAQIKTGEHYTSKPGER